MFTAVPLLCALLVADVPHIDVKFEQVSPAPPEGKLMGRSKEQTRAIVLLHGLHPLSLSDSGVGKAKFSPWQEAQSQLVKDLVKVGDVFGFAYSQDAGVLDILSASKLSDHVAELRQMGYREIVLVGHSAGGLLARHFVEDHPKSGVTKVVQVCAPNGGSNWAKFPGVRKSQKPFVESLTKESRQECLKMRKEKVIPDDVEFLCIVGTSSGDGDGIVARECQWTEELRKQGIPAVCVTLNHIQAMRTPKGADAIVEAIKQKQPRWNEEKVQKSLRDILNH